MVVKNSRVMVDGIPDKFEADQTRLPLPGCSAPPVAAVRWVLQFALSAELQAMLRRRQFSARKRRRRPNRYKLAHPLTEIDKALQAAA